MTQKKHVCTSQAELAEVCGKSVATVQYWVKNGMPGRPGAYDLAKVIPWLLTTGKASKAMSDDDPLLASGDSPGLERYRLAKAELAELELEVRKGALIPLDSVRDMLGRWSSLIRRMGDSLAKRFGKEAAELLNETLAECKRVVPIDGNTGPTDSTDD